jgi:hypothetical protein
MKYISLICIFAFVIESNLFSQSFSLENNDINVMVKVLKIDDSLTIETEVCSKSSTIGIPEYGSGSQCNYADTQEGNTLYVYLGWNQISTMAGAIFPLKKIYKGSCAKNTFKIPLQKGIIPTQCLLQINYVPFKSRKRVLKYIELTDYLRKMTWNEVLYKL